MKRMRRGLFVPDRKGWCRFSGNFAIIKLSETILR